MKKNILKELLKDSSIIISKTETTGIYSIRIDAFSIKEDLLIEFAKMVEKK